MTMVSCESLFTFSFDIGCQLTSELSYKSTDDDDAVIAVAAAATVCLLAAAVVTFVVFSHKLQCKNKIVTLLFFYF